MERMEKSAELLLRSALHDMANVLAGVRGIVDLNSPGQPLSQRDRDRLEAVVEEGITTLDRCRQLALETLPGRDLESGAAWRACLQEELAPLTSLFRCRFELIHEGDPRWDRWPGPLLRGYVRAVSRMVLPYVKGGLLTIHFSAGPENWQVRWTPATLLPDSLAPGQPDRPRDICGRWALAAATALAATLTLEDATLEARLPRV
jgi:hypothetical protein